MTSTMMAHSRFPFKDEMVVVFNFRVHTVAPQIGHIHTLNTPTRALTSLSRSDSQLKFHVILRKLKYKQKEAELKEQYYEEMKSYKEGETWKARCTMARSRDC